MDIATTFITQAALALVVATQLLLTWYYDKNGSRAALHWAFAFYCVVLGWCVILLRTNTNDILPTIIINLAFLAAPILILSGVFVRIQVKIPVKRLLMILGSYFVFQTSLTFLNYSTEIKIVGINAFLAAIQFYSVLLVMRSNLGALANRVLAFGFLVVGMASMTRVFGILLTGDDIYAADQQAGRLFFILLAVVNITEGFTCLGALLIDRIDLVSRQALTDPLTRCLNRRGFDEVAEKAINQAKRGDNQIVLIVADLDRFKRVNDTYGHGAGDNTIKTFAQLLAEEIRSVDHLGRLGGEEFIVLLWQTDLEGAKELVFRIRQRLWNTIIQGLPKDFRVTSSFGATIIESDDQDINAIIHRADLALYQAKNNGRDQIQCLTKSQEKEAQTAFDNLETAEKA